MLGGVHDGGGFGHLGPELVGDETPLGPGAVGVVLAAEAALEWLHAKAPGRRIDDEVAGGRVSLLDATWSARKFVVEAEDQHGADYRNDPALIREDLRLFAAVDRIEIGLAEVRNALVAAAVLTTTGPLRTPVQAEV